jgi:hypothetical protein
VEKGAQVTKLHAINIPVEEARGAVIFVPGLGGDPNATWRSDGDETFWPSWLVKDISKLEVFTLAYDASSSTWFGYAMGLPDRAASVLATLVANRLDAKPLVFVCHSLGGLVIKQLLRIAARSWNTRGKDTRSDTGRCVPRNAEYRFRSRELGWSVLGGVPPIGRHR